MTVVGLHPEQLIDKLEAGVLSSAERAQLDAHLANCTTCRIELAMRSDFAADAPLAFPEHPELLLEATEPEALPVRRPSTAAARRGRRRRLALLALAATLCASGAVAALSNHGLPWSSWFRESAPTANQAAVSPPSSKGHGRKNALGPGAAASASAALSEAPAGPEPSEDLNAEAALAPSALATAAQTAPSAEPHAQITRPLELAPKSEPSVPSAASAAEAIPSGRAEFPPVAGETPETPEAAASEAAHLFAEASRARRDGNTGRAVTLYRQLEHDYPSSPESQVSVALLAKLMLDRGDPEAAAADYDRYLHEGSPVLGAEALVGRARALEQLGKLDAAAAAWREVQQRFPGTVHARLAATRLAALGGR